MKKLLVMLSFGVMLLGSPALSHAAFVNYSGATTKASAKVINLDLGSAFQTSTMNVSVPAGTKNAAVSIDTSTGQISGTSYFPGGRLQFGVSGALLKKGSGLIGNVLVLSVFYSGTVTYDPSSDTYTGDGKIVSFGSGAKCSFVPTSATTGILMIQNISPVMSSSQDVAGGVVNSTENPVVVKSLTIPPIKLVMHP